MNSIETRVLRFIGESTSSPDVFTSSNLDPIQDSINDAIEELCTMSNSVINTYRISLVAETNLYRLDFDRNQFCYIVSAYLPDKNRSLSQSSIGAVEKYDYRWMSTNNTPLMYFPIGVDQVGFYPMYSSSGNQVELKCAVLPERYSRDTEVLQIRSDWEDALVNYAVAEYFANVQDWEKATHWFAEYSKYAGQFGYRTKMPDRWVTAGEVQ